MSSWPPPPPPPPAPPPPFARGSQARSQISDQIHNTTWNPNTPNHDKSDRNNFMANGSHVNPIPPSFSSNKSQPPMPSQPSPPTMPQRPLPPPPPNNYSMTLKSPKPLPPPPIPAPIPAQAPAPIPAQAPAPNTFPQRPPPPPSPPVYMNTTLNSNSFHSNSNAQRFSAMSLSSSQPPPPTMPQRPLTHSAPPMTQSNMLPKQHLDSFQYLPPPSFQQHPPPPTPTHHAPPPQTHAHYFSPQHQPPPPPPPPTTTNLPNQPNYTNAKPSNHANQKPLPKIDLSQVPRPPSHNHPLFSPAQIYRTKHTLESTASSQTPPPQASSRFITIDDGNASPRLIRSTTYHFPMNRFVREKTALPLAVMLTPLSLPDSSESKPPLMDGRTGPSGPTGPTNNNNYATTTQHPNIPNNHHIEPNQQAPIKCTRCLAYLNPFVKWQNIKQDGYYNAFECIFCNRKNQITHPPHLWSTKKGTVEYLVDGPYITSDDGTSLVQNIHLYALDCSTIWENDTNHNEKKGEKGPLWLYHEYLNCLSDVAECLNDTYEKEINERKWSLCAEVDDQYRPRIGFCFIMPDGTIAIPYLNDKNMNNHVDQNTEQQSLSVAIMSDVRKDPFSPIPLSKWTYNVTSDKDMISWHCVLNLAPTLFRHEYFPNMANLGSSGGAVLSLMVDALSKSGGRCTLITSSRPTLGIGTLLNRAKDPLVYSRSLDEQRACTPIQCLKETEISLGDTHEYNKTHEVSASFYQKLAQRCHKSKVSIDIFIIQKQINENYLDTATLGEVCRATCGQLKIIPNNAESTPCEEVLKEELIRSVSRNVAFDVILKVRCSPGVTMKAFLNPPGKVFDNGITNLELEMSTMTTDTCICACLDHQTGGIKGKKDKKAFAYIQSVLLYTTPFGQRKLRISTLALPCTEQVAEVFKGADFGSIAAVLTRKAIVNAMLNGIRVAKLDVVSACVDILHQYRINTSAKESPTGQLILPEGLQLLPLFCMSLRKNGLLRSAVPPDSFKSALKNPQPCVDERMYLMFHAAKVSSSLSMLLVHPNVYDLSNLKGREGFEYIPKPYQRSTLIDEACAPYIQLPQTCHSSINFLKDDSIYLIDNGFELYLFVGRAVSNELRLEFFRDRDSPSTQITLTSDYGKRVQKIIQQIRECCNSRPTWPSIIVYLSGESKGEARKQKTHTKIMTLLVDDATSQEKGYVDFLCSIHKKIRLRLSES